MEEKERFELKIYAGCEYYSITDTKEKQQITIENTINLLNQQHKRIKELEETNKVLSNELTKNSILKQRYIETCCGIPIFEIPKIKEENQQLKQLLCLSDSDKVYEKYFELKQQLAEKDKEIEQLKKFDDLNRNFFALFRTAFKEPDKVDDLFNTLKTIQEKHNQDKISFALEQLEKVKEKILSYENVYYQFLESGAKVPVVCLENFRVKQTIDNQIKQLKEGVKNE